MILCMGCMTELVEGTRVCPRCGYVAGTPVKEACYLIPGTILHERYVVGKVLGHGGFGITYIGYDAFLNGKIAIKEYFPNKLAARTAGTKKVSVYSGSAGSQYQMGLDSFIKEARRLTKFRDIPEIVNIYDCILENGTGYIIMELLSGETVKELLAKRGTFSYEEAENILLYVMDGLNAVHQGGIIHRDIAPDNIMITQEGKVKLLDFGAAKYTLNARAKDRSIILKPGYAPKEQYSADGNQGPWTDVYGVGATMYRMITGIRPQESTRRAEDDQLQPPSALGVWIPPAAEAILMRSLAVEMQQRIPNLQEFKHSLLRCRDMIYQEGPVFTGPGGIENDGPQTGGGGSEEEPPPRFPWKTTVIILLLASALLVTAGLIVDNTRDPENSFLHYLFQRKNGEAEGETGSGTLNTDTENGNGTETGSTAETQSGGMDPTLEDLENKLEENGSNGDGNVTILTKETSAEKTAHTYQFLRRDCSWTEAYQACQEMGGYLVQINTQEEYDYILSEIRYHNMEDVKFYLGGKRETNSYDYYWAGPDGRDKQKLNDQSAWCQNAWMKNEPSFRDGTREEYYMNMFYFKDEQRWVWNDIPDDLLAVVPTYSGTVGLICEFE